MKDGGSAFPVLDAKYGYDGENLGLACSDTGMTLRDWFAGQAAVGLLADTDGVEMPPGVMSVYQLVAEAAYRYADAMLAAREKTV